MKFEDILGFEITSLKYRGENIFSIMVMSLEDKNICYSLNLLDCHGLEDDGIIGRVLTKINTYPLGMRHIFFSQKFGLDQTKYRELKMESNNGSIFVAMVGGVDLTDDIHRYNPISEDKY